MGLSWCNSQSTFNSESKKLFQINTESNVSIITEHCNINNIDTSCSINNNNINSNEDFANIHHNKSPKHKNTLSNNQHKPSFPSSLFLSILDIENEKYYTSNINLRILSSLKGISQLNADNSLYLCGTEDIASTSGSYLLKLKLPKISKPSIQFLVSSHFVHIYPSLYFSPKASALFVVGGKDQIKCELFDIELNKWKYLPDLPEERYLCTLMSSNEEQHLYLFGGFCKAQNTKCNTLLRMHIEQRTYWEKLIINENSHLIQKTSSAAFNVFDKESERDCIYILGGKNAKSEYTDEIVEYNVNKRTVSLIDKLNEKASFLNQIGVNVTYRSVLFFDKKAKVINVDLCEHSIKCSTYGDFDYIVQSERTSN